MAYRGANECEGGYELPANGGPCRTCGATQHENCRKPKSSTNLLLQNERMREALREIAARRNVMKPARNEYDSGYNLGTELCCDIADEALTCAKEKHE